MDIKTILVAMDFSKNSDFVITKSIEIARKSNAKLIIMHVCQKKTLDEFVNILHCVLPKNFWHIVTENKKQRLQDMVITLSKKHELMIEGCFVEDGKPPAVEILEYIIKNPVDLLVIGGHEKYSTRETYIGTTANYIVELIQCPVLIVKEKTKKPYQNILFPVDFSKTSKNSLNYGCCLFSNATFSLLNIIDNDYEKFIKNEMQTNAEIINLSDELKEQTLIASSIKMKEFANLCEKPISDEQCQIKFNAPGLAIIKEASKLDYDLIVMGMQGNTLTHYLKVGSVANYVLKEANKDILLVPALA
jgi:universal stress protein E